MLSMIHLAHEIKQHGKTLGFQQVGITKPNLERHINHLSQWLNKKRHGEMAYMAKNIDKRKAPDILHPGTIRIISVRLDYLPPSASIMKTLTEREKAAISIYAQGRDYHKIIRKKLQKLALYIESKVGPFGYRAFTDSAPVLEKALAEEAGLGFIGKNTNLINPEAGSWFFLGELFTDLPLPIDTPSEHRCGSCNTCIEVCPTGAIVAPFELDARKCISYLTIELKGVIPEKFRAAIGNRVYGCDDCQLVCPWNKFAQVTTQPDFLPRKQLAGKTLLELFSWSEEEFLKHTEGSAIRRIGYLKWLQNLAIGLGNAPFNDAILASLQPFLEHPNEPLREHARWAFQQQLVTG